MNDLYYIEYNPELMLSDSIDMDAQTELAHRRLCDFIWRMDKAPKSDNDFLKQFTKTKPEDWGRVKKGLLEKGWAEVEGIMLHGGAIKSLNDAKMKYAAQCNQTAPATAKKNGTNEKIMVCERNSATGIITLKVTSTDASSVKSTVTSNVPTGQLKPELEPVKQAVATPPAVAVAAPPPPPKQPSPAQLKAGKEFRWREGVMTLWLARYKSDHGGTEYQPTAGDKGHLTTFSKTAQMQASDFVAMAARAWKRPSHGKFSHCQNAHSISYMCRYYNQIVEELKNEISVQFNKRNIGVPGDAASRAKATADFVARQQREHAEANREPV